MKITIQTIPHSEQRYPTVGDWIWINDDELMIAVSEMPDWRHVALVAVHELAEVLMCKQAGITQKQVDDFDIDFESKRVKGNEDEPGDDPAAPYVKQHCIASGIERVLAAELGVSWKLYEQELMALP
jgi:hypothetical protein